MLTTLNKVIYLYFRTMTIVPSLKLLSSAATLIYLPYPPISSDKSTFILVLINYTSKNQGLTQDL